MDILTNGFQITVIGMGVVFLVLFLLSLIISLFKVFIYQDEEEQVTEKKTPDAPVLNRMEGDEEKEIVVAISSVMSTILKDNEYVCNIRQL